MKILSIETNLRGKPKTFNLGPVNLVVGDNMDGKSTVLSAFKLTLTGCDKRFGARPTSAFALSGGLDMPTSAPSSKTGG